VGCGLRLDENRSVERRQVLLDRDGAAGKRFVREGGDGGALVVADLQDERAA